jgi:branched-chain amino acid transport system ATP-binding protein
LCAVNLDKAVLPHAKVNPLDQCGFPVTLNSSNDTPILEVKGLTKHFGALTAVNGVNLRVNSGIQSVIGPNGAGKTTFFNLLSGFLVPDKGQIFFQGKDITGSPPYEISQMGIGRSFQITSIFPGLTVHENMRIACQSRSKSRYNFMISYKGLQGVDVEAERIIREVGLGEWAHSPARNLPYGLQRCLDIGISMATAPQLLLLDEPTSGMSTEDIETILRLIENISKAMPVILIEHNVDMVLAISDRIAVLYQGVLLAEGTSLQIQANKEVQEAYLGGY